MARRARLGGPTALEAVLGFIATLVGGRSELVTGRINRGPDG